MSAGLNPCQGSSGKINLSGIRSSGRFSMPVGIAIAIRLLTLKRIDTR